MQAYGDNRGEALNAREINKGRFWLAACSVAFGRYDQLSAIQGVSFSIRGSFIRNNLYSVICITWIMYIFHLRAVFLTALVKT